jgi:hypothetical protein
MMDAQYTPGPWYWEPRSYEGSTRRDVFLNSANPVQGAILALREDFADWRPWERSANAHLIAASPAMADALREIITHCAPLVQAGDPLGLAIQRIARQALSTATGDTANATR